LTENDGASRTNPTMSRSRLLISLLVAALIGGMLAPVAVKASKNLITIVGPGSSKQSSGVKVNNGKLSVGDGKGPMTVDGSVKVPDGVAVNGPVSIAEPVTVDGAVNAATADTTAYIGFLETGDPFSTAGYSQVRIAIGGDTDYTIWCVEDGVDVVALALGGAPAQFTFDVPCRTMRVQFRNVFLGQHAFVWGRP